MSLSFHDYALLREIAEVIPGSFKITRGNLIFHEQNFGANTAEMPPDSAPVPAFGGEMPSNLQAASGPAGTSQATLGASNQKSSLSDPSIKRDFKLINNLTDRLENDEIKKRMKHWLSKNFMSSKSHQAMPLDQQTGEIPGFEPEPTTQPAGGIPGFSGPTGMDTGVGADKTSEFDTQSIDASGATPPRSRRTADFLNKRQDPGYYKPEDTLSVKVPRGRFKPPV